MSLVQHACSSLFVFEEEKAKEEGKIGASKGTDYDNYELFTP